MSKFIPFAILAAVCFAAPTFAGTSNCDLKVDDAVHAILKQDVDASGAVSVSEALNAYAYFDATIRDLSKMESLPIRKAIFTYLLKNEKLPVSGPSFLAWMAKRPFWKFERDESQVRKAMNAFYLCE